MADASRCDWQTFGPGGPLQDEVRLCIKCGTVGDGACPLQAPAELEGLPTLKGSFGRLEAFLQDADAAGETRVTVYREDLRVMLTYAKQAREQYETLLTLHDEAHEAAWANRNRANLYEAEIRRLNGNQSMGIVGEEL